MDGTCECGTFLSVRGYFFSSEDWDTQKLNASVRYAMQSGIYLNYICSPASLP